MSEWYNSKICEDKCWEFEEKYSFIHNCDKRQNGREM